MQDTSSLLADRETTKPTKQGDANRYLNIQFSTINYSTSPFDHLLIDFSQCLCYTKREFGIEP
jgi:hypothetical protein